jgi:fucose 4-O-acetylase-like acetyltransferase
MQAYMEMEPRELQPAMMVPFTLWTSMALLLFLAIYNSVECATLSCAMDKNELSDRVGSVSLTLHAFGSAMLWYRRIPDKTHLHDFSE